MDSVLKPGDSARLATLHERVLEAQEAEVRLRLDPQRYDRQHQEAQRVLAAADAAFHEALSAVTWPNPYDREASVQRRPR